MELIALPSPRGQAVWAGTSQGLARIEGERWTVFRAGSGGLPGDDVRALEALTLTDGRHILWAGTNRGLGRFEGERWTAASVPCLPHPWVFAIHPATAPDGTRWLWIGTQGGVARMRLDVQGRLQGPCEALTDRTRPALSHSLVAQIQSDAWGRIYVFTNWGVTRINLPASGGLAAARVETFDAGDGLPGMEFNSTSFRDHLGRIWGGATGGAAVLDPAPPRKLPPQRTGAPLILEHVKVTGRERSLANGAVLRHNEDSLEFQYALLSYGREHKTVYRTQLAGLEDEPSPWSHEARAVYNRLPQGSYTFRAWGRDSEGTVSGPIEVAFQIRPAPWLTPWAIGLYAATLMGLGYGANHVRVKTLARRAAHLETQVAERTRELAEANRKLELASLTDPLTGLSNRRFLDLNIGPDLQQAIRSSQASYDRRDHSSDLIFYFIDFDHFKRLNDQAGHAGGDEVLVEVGRRLRTVARTTDAVVRWGGEEFLIVSRWTDRRAGSVLAARILEVVALEPFTVAGRSVFMTCSVGWAPFPWHLAQPGAVSFEAMLSLADRALYLAKREGRNRAVGVLPGPLSPATVPLPDDALEPHEGELFELVRTPGPGVRSEAPLAAPTPAWIP
jgi:diguanylate cyclase (GGDEF)-like protein